jgi:hypothetical protein
MKSAVLRALVALVLMCVPANAQKSGAVGDKIFGITKLHKIRLTISAAEWAVLQTSNARGGGTTGGTDYKLADGRLIHVGSGFAGYFPWAHADVRMDDQAGLAGNVDDTSGLGVRAEFKDVGIRYKGNFSFTSSSAAVPLFANFKLKIDLHGTKGSWDGEKTFNFQAGVLDQSRMKEALAFAIFRAAGVPAPRTAYAELMFTVPGVYQDVPGGLYTMVEDVNSRFLERALAPGTGLIMKPEGLRGGILSKGTSWPDYVTALRPDRDATLPEQKRVMEFSQLVSQSDVALFRSKIGTYLDVDEFLRFIAVNAFIVNSDSYIGGGHNFYVYLDSRDDKVRFIPWDQDLSMGGRNGNNGFDLLKPYSGDQALIYWLLDDPAVMTRYREILKELTATAFSPAEITKLVDAIEKVGTGRAGSPRTFLDGRAAYAQQLVAAWK